MQILEIGDNRNDLVMNFVPPNIVMPKFPASSEADIFCVFSFLIEFLSECEVIHAPSNTLLNVEVACACFTYYLVILFSGIFFPAIIESSDSVLITRGVNAGHFDFALVPNDEVVSTFSRVPATLVQISMARNARF